MMLLTTSTFVLSVAVTSMKTFLVFTLILEWSEFITGGKEQTVRLESNMTG